MCYNVLMSKKHSRSYREAETKKKQQLNDPDFAGKKAVRLEATKNQDKKTYDKNFDDNPSGSEGTKSKSSTEKPQKNKNKNAKKSSGRRHPEHSAGKAVSAKALHNKDAKKQTASKKSVVIPDEFKKKSEGTAPVEIEVKTKKSDSDQKNKAATPKTEKQSADAAANTPKIASVPKPTEALKQFRLADPKPQIDRHVPLTKKQKNQTAAKPEEASSKKIENQPKTPKQRFDWRKTWRKHPMPAILRITCLILLLAGISILFTWFILWRTNSCDADLVAEFIGKKPLLFSYSCLVIFFLMAIVAAITWHVFFTIGLSFAAASIITFISMQKFELREEPLLPSDFVFAGQTGNLIGMVDASAIWRLISGVILILLGSILLEIYACKMLGKRIKGRPWWERHSLIPRATYTIISLAGLMMITGPVFHHEKPEWLEGLSEVAWDQTRTYGYNGFVIDFISNMRKTAAAKPHNYSQDTIMKIAEKYWAIKEADDENRKPLNEIADRIFIILDESFYDPSIIKDYYDYGKKDVLPVTYKIFEQYPSGYMYSPGYGGATANIEFEVQTGYSNYWANSYPYIDVVSKSDSILSAASWAKKYGFNTGAIHAYWGDMYSRRTAYPVLGYDDFIDIDEMTIHRYEPGTPWPNDNAIFDEALDLTDGNSPTLINVVTMQNHGGYSDRGYAELEFEIQGGSRKNEIARYYQLLNASDKYLGDLIKKLENSKEKSVILWFGDHAAGIFPEIAESDNKAERDLARLTPYFIWANFDLESDSKKALNDVAEQNKKLGLNLSKVKGVDLPTTTPNCLLNQLYNTLGAEKPALFYLLDEVCKKAPILTGSFYDGVEFPNDDVVKEYELVNYDIMNGQKYWDGE